MRWLSHAEKDALICGDRHLSYKEFAGGIAHTAALMSSRLQTGDRVVLLGGNSLEWAMAFYGIWHIHGVAVPVDFMSTPEEIAFILSDCAPSIVWSDGGSMEKLSRALESLPEGSRPAVMSLDSLSKAAPFTPPESLDSLGESPDEDMALLIYTSGTTGAPKGVMLTFGNIRANTESCSREIEVFIPEDRVLVVLPLHHAYPLMGSLVMPISIGATSVFATEMNGQAILEALQKHQCTFIIGVPRLLELFRNAMMQKVNATWIGRLFFRLCRACRSLSLSRKVFAKAQKTFGGKIRYIASGGAAASPEMIRDFYTLGFQLLEGYGMTETAPMISFTRPGRVRPGSPGIPIPCNEVKIQDGEVLVRGKNVMKGYYHRPEETAQALDGEGWLHTGDLGYVDKDGFLFLTGRSKELIILGNGKNINPSDLEEHLMVQAPGLMAECAVAERGSHLVAIAVPDMEAIAKRGILNLRQTLMDLILEPYNQHSPSYKRIADLVLWNHPLPRTRLGKLRRHLIRQELQGGKATPSQGAQATPPPDTEAYRTLLQCLEGLTGRPCGPDEHLELDLGLDSLAKITLLSTLESQHGYVLQAEELAQHPTPRALAQCLQEKGKAPAQAKSAQDAPVTLPHTAWTHGLVRGLGSLLLHAISRIEVRGRENIPQGPCIFAPNHQSALDGLYLGIAMDRRRFLDTYFYAAAKFITGGLTGFFARRHNMIPMDLNSDLRKTLGILSLALEKGKSIAIFPEGTRSLDGQLAPFRPSFAQLALERNAPIVPVVLEGPLQVLPRGKTFPSWGKRVTVTFLPPLLPQAGDDAQGLCETTRQRIQERLS